MLYIGGAFAPMGPIRSDYLFLVHGNRLGRVRGLDAEWAELRTLLGEFIWSDKAFLAQVKAFWMESLENACA